MLVDWDPRYLLCGRLGHSRAEADRYLARIFTRRWHAGLDGGRSFAEASAALAREHPQHAEVIRCYADGWSDMFAGEFPASVRMLRALKSEGLRLHALSNYPGEQIAFLYRRFPFMRDFDTVVLSGVIGVQKPSVEMFDYLAARIRTRHCVYLDDRAENVAAARACGMQAIRYTPPPPDAGWNAIVDAAGIRELLSGRLPTPD